MDIQGLKAEKRGLLGRKVARLRREGILPANIYGKKAKSQAVQVDTSDFEKVFAKAGETGLVELKVDGRKRTVLIHNVQTDPVTDTLLHADFFQVDLKEKVSAKVPVELSGESPAEKEDKGTVVQYIDEVEVEALPKDLPEKFEIDLSGLREVDAAIYIKDLSFDKKRVRIEEDSEQIIVKVEPPRKIEEEAPAVEEEAIPAEEATVEGEEKPKEGKPSAQPKTEEQAKVGSEDEKSTRKRQQKDSQKAQR